MPTDQRDDRPIAPLAVIMPTWNAGPYLEPLLDSLAAQTFDDWTLLVRDDGSSDGTLDQLQRRAAADPRIQLLTDSRGHLGAAAGFGLLLMEALHRGAAYVACCDQDDRWHPEKLARQIQSLRATESDLAEATPLLSTMPTSRPSGRPSRPPSPPRRSPRNSQLACCCRTSIRAARSS